MWYTAAAMAGSRAGSGSSSSAAILLRQLLPSGPQALNDSAYSKAWASAGAEACSAQGPRPQNVRRQLHASVPGRVAWTSWPQGPASGLSTAPLHVQTGAGALGSASLRPGLALAWPRRHLGAPAAAVAGSFGQDRAFAVLAFPLAQTGEGISECELVEMFVKVGGGRMLELQGLRERARAGLLPVARCGQAAALCSPACFTDSSPAMVLPSHPQTQDSLRFP